MKKFWIQIAALLAVIFASLYLSFGINSFGRRVAVQSEQAKSRLQIKDSSGSPKASLAVEIADTVAKRGIGLGGRENLATDSGMLFVFEKEGTYQFWMKGLNFPLDFIWIRDGTVVDILPEVPNPSPGQSDESLPRLEPVVPVDKVLEVNSGYAQRYGIDVGDKIELSL